MLVATHEGKLKEKPSPERMDRVWGSTRDPISDWMEDRGRSVNSRHGKERDSSNKVTGFCEVEAAFVVAVTRDSRVLRIKESSFRRFLNESAGQSSEDSESGLWYFFVDLLVVVRSTVNDLSCLSEVTLLSLPILSIATAAGGAIKLRMTKVRGFRGYGQVKDCCFVVKNGVFMSLAVATTCVANAIIVYFHFFLGLSWCLERETKAMEFIERERCVYAD